MIRTLDLFCGGGGSSWGAMAAGARIICGVDAWDLASQTFGDNFPGACAVNIRLHQRSNRRSLPDIGPIHLLLASPECTNHSCAKGSKERCENSRSTARYVLNFAKIFHPRWIMVENVIQMRHWSGYPDLMQALRREYFVREEVLDAADFGVPQTRRRLFLVCDREREPHPIRASSDRKPRNARDILDPFGMWPVTPLFSKRRAQPTLERAARAIRALGEGVPFLIVYYGTDGSGGWQSLDRPLRTLTTLDRFGLVEWDSGEPTLRMLQVPELKRAMGFRPVGREYRLERGSRRDRIKLLGNGVSPPVMEAIVRSLTEECDSGETSCFASMAAE